MTADRLIEHVKDGCQKLNGCECVRENFDAGFRSVTMLAVFGFCFAPI